MISMVSSSLSSRWGILLAALVVSCVARLADASLLRSSHRSPFNCTSTCARSEGSIVLCRSGDWRSTAVPSPFSLNPSFNNDWCFENCVFDITLPTPFCVPNSDFETSLTSIAPYVPDAHALLQPPRASDQAKLASLAHFDSLFTATVRRGRMSPLSDQQRATITAVLKEREAKGLVDKEEFSVCGWPTSSPLSHLLSEINVYSCSGGRFHEGDLLQHAVWASQAALTLFSLPPSDPRHIYADGLRNFSASSSVPVFIPCPSCPTKEGRFSLLLELGGLMHDIAKAGWKGKSNEFGSWDPLFERAVFSAVIRHPEMGFCMLSNNIDHLINDESMLFFDSKGQPVPIWSSPSLAGLIPSDMANLTPLERKLVTIMAGMHYEVGNFMVRLATLLPNWWLSEADVKLARQAAHAPAWIYFQWLRQYARLINLDLSRLRIGPANASWDISELEMVRMSIVVAVADVMGSHHQSVRWQEGFRGDEDLLQGRGKPQRPQNHPAFAPMFYDQTAGESDVASGSPLPVSPFASTESNSTAPVEPLLLPVDCYRQRIRDDTLWDFGAYDPDKAGQAVFFLLDWYQKFSEAYPPGSSPQDVPPPQATSDFFTTSPICDQLNVKDFCRCAFENAFGK
eukprot:GILI01004359.1.p1 GENE.GILI01004359.1~~GILI01004359.1.p1  ORF type:complete len:647 (-),score=154.46 GILI01004359.1:1465-3342(-)